MKRLKGKYTVTVRVNINVNCGVILGTVLSAGNATTRKQTAFQPLPHRFMSTKMEMKSSLPRTRKRPLRNGKVTRETLNFRRAARQVMLANMFTRKTTNGHYVKSASSAKSAAVSQDHVPHRLVTKRERKHSSNMAEKPPMKRRGTPELFPMSEEMKQTVISLGKLDLLPSEVRKVRGDSVDEDSRTEKSRASYTFREKTRQRIIHPQRFIRNVRSSLINSKRIPENTEENCEEEVDEITKDDDNDTSKDKTEDKANNNNSTEERDAALITRKSNCNILSRAQNTNFHLTANSAKNQHYSINKNRPIYATRFSDLGPLTTRPRPLGIPSQGMWPKITFDSTRMQTREYYFPKKTRSNTVTGKAWVSDENSPETKDKNNDSEALKTRRWKSVESLTREIEIKCLSWLENRYGSGMIQ